MLRYFKYLFIPTMFIIITFIVFITTLINNPVYLDKYIKKYMQQYLDTNYSIAFNYENIDGNFSGGYTLENLTFSKNKNILFNIDTLFFSLNPLSKQLINGIHLKNITARTSIINHLNSQNTIAKSNIISNDGFSYPTFNFTIENINLKHKDFISSLNGKFKLSISDSLTIYSSSFEVYNKSFSENINSFFPDFTFDKLVFDSTEVLIKNSFNEIEFRSNFSGTDEINRHMIIKIDSDNNLYAFNSKISNADINYLSKGTFDLNDLSFKSHNNLVFNETTKGFNANFRYIFDNNYNNDRLYVEIVDDIDNSVILNGNIDLYSLPNSNNINLSSHLTLDDEVVKLIWHNQNIQFEELIFDSKNVINFSDQLFTSDNFINVNGAVYKDNIISHLNTQLSLNYIDNKISSNLIGEFHDLSINGKNFNYGSINSLLTDKNFIVTKVNLNNEVGDEIFISSNYKHKNFISIDTLAASLRGSKLQSQNIFIYKNDEKFTSNEFSFNIGKNGYSNGSVSFKSINDLSIDLFFNKIDLSDINNLTNSKIMYSGTSSGKIQAKIINNEPILLIDLNIDNGNYDKIIFDQITMLGSYVNKKVIINNFIYSNYKDKFTLNGWFTGDINNDYIFSLDELDSLDIDIDLSNFMFSKINRYLPFPEIVNGYGSGKINAKGLISNPLINLNLDIDSPVYDRLFGNDMKLRAIYKNHLFYLKQLSLNTDLGRYTASGFMPITKNDRNQSYDVIITGKSDGMELLEPYIPSIDSIRGDISFKLELSGNDNKFQKNGMINFIDTKIHYRDLNNYTEALNGTADIINNKLIIKNLSGIMENKIRNDFTNFASKITSFLYTNNKNKIGSNLFFNGSINLNNFFKPDYAINIKGDNIFLDDSDGRFYGNGDLDIFFTGQDTLEIKGNFTPSGYDFKVLELYSNRINIDENLDTYSENMTNIDIHFTINDPIKVETENLNLAVDGDVNMISKNNSDISFIGKLSIIDGKFYDTQGNVFTNTNGEIILNPVDLHPFVDIHTQTSISDEVIELSLSGFTDNPNLILESTSDKFTQTDILELLTFRTIDSDSQDEDKITKFFSNYIEKEIERNITKYSVLDEFEFRSDKSIISNDDETDLNLFIGKQLSNKIYLNTEFPIDDMNRMQYQVIYRINKNMSVVARVDDEKYWHLNYKIKYYY